METKVETAISPLLHSLDETARLLSISVSGVDRLEKSGALNSIRLGGRRLFRRSDLEALIEKQAAIA